MSLNLVNWNVEWATPKSHRSHEIRRRIDEHPPDIVCLTESHQDLMANTGHTTHARPDYGYPIKKGRRKVILWSRNPWKQVDDLGNESLPPGRFISGSTQTSVGTVTVVGICIPWAGSRTEARRGPRRKRRWEDHEDYLSGLASLLPRMSAGRLIVVGDFNQRLGQDSRTPIRFQTALQSALSSRLTIATSELDFQGRKSIDHIALSDDLSAASMSVISNISGETKLSDHFGVFAEVAAF